MIKYAWNNKNTFYVISILKYILFTADNHATGHIPGFVG